MVTQQLGSFNDLYSLNTFYILFRYIIHDLEWRKFLLSEMFVSQEKVFFLFLRDPSSEKTFTN